MWSLHSERRSCFAYDHADHRRRSQTRGTERCAQNGVGDQAIIRVLPDRFAIGPISLDGSPLSDNFLTHAILECVVTSLEA